MSQYTAQYIAESFVKQYYEILAHSPVDLHKFYLPEATFAFQEPLQSTENVIGMEQIRHRVAQLNLFGSYVDVSSGSVDAQRFESTRILVVVTGTFTRPPGLSGITSRPFVNSFILVGTNNAYFVSNSVFRFLSAAVVVPLAPAQNVVTSAVTDFSAPLTSQQQPSSQRNATEILKSAIEVSHSHSTPGLGSHQSSSVSLNATEQSRNEIAEIVLEVTSEKEIAQISTTETSVEADEDVPTYEEVTNEAEQTHQQPIEVESETTTSVKSYLDIVKRLAAKTEAEKGGTVGNVGNKVIRARPAGQTNVVPDLNGAVVPKNGADVPSGSKQTNPTGTAGQQLFSVYVNSLPEKVTEQELATLFTIFGKVVQVDLTRGRKYGFVKFETVAAMQAALDYEQPLELNGVRLQVEEKTSPKTKSEGSGRRRDRERDRGDREREHRDREKGEKSTRAQKNGDFKKGGRKDGGDKGSGGGDSGKTNNAGNINNSSSTSNQQQFKTSKK